MMGSKWLAALLVCVALVSSGSNAWADPTPQEKEHARDLMAEGREKRDKSDLVNALESFKQADAIMHVPTTGYEVAKTQQLIGKLIEARETVDAILKLPVQPTDPPPFAEARTKAETLGKELDKQIPLLKIVLKSNVSSPTTVTVDDVLLASLETPAPVNPGKHVVFARSDDGETRVEITVVAGDVKDVPLRLDKKPVVITSTPTPTKSGTIPTLSWIGFGVGAAGLVVGTVTGLMAMSAESDIADQCTPAKKCSSKVRDDLDSAKTKATISTVGFIVAGVGAAVGVVGLFVGKPKVEANVGTVRIDFSRLSGTF